MANKKNDCWYAIWNSFLIILCLGLILFIFYYFFKTDLFYKSRYPLKYEEIVSKYCEEYGVNDYLIYSIIRTESFFDEKSISPKGAIGLMQIMPDTGKWIAEKIGLEKFSNEDLFDCEKNIMIGVWYLDFLLNKFDGNVHNAIAAYNAGPTSVSKWLLDEDISSSGELINIPFKETDEYVKKVINAYDMYSRVYGNV